MKKQIKKEEILAHYCEVTVPQFMITRNRFLAKSLWPWSSNMFKNRYVFRDTDNIEYINLEARTEYANIAAFQSYSWPRIKDQNKLVPLYKDVLSKGCNTSDFNLSLSTQSVFNEYAKALKEDKKELAEIIINSYVTNAPNEKIGNQRLIRLKETSNLIVRRPFYVRPMHGLGMS